MTPEEAVRAAMAANAAVQAAYKAAGSPTVTASQLSISVPKPSPSSVDTFITAATGTLSRNTPDALLSQLGAQLSAPITSLGEELRKNERQLAQDVQNTLLIMGGLLLAFAFISGRRGR